MKIEGNHIHALTSWKCNLNTKSWVHNQICERNRHTRAQEEKKASYLSLYPIWLPQGA